MRKVFDLVISSVYCLCLTNHMCSKTSVFEENQCWYKAFLNSGEWLAAVASSMQTYTQEPHEVRIPPTAARCLAVIGIIMSLGWQQKQTLRSVVEFCLPKQEGLTGLMWFCSKSLGHIWWLVTSNDCWIVAPSSGTLLKEE